MNNDILMESIKYNNMLPAFLITFREVIEATLIVATILGILVKLKQKKAIRSVWLATGAAAGLSILFLLAGSILGIKIQQIYSGRIEEIIEGILMVTSALFITWAVFFLHNYFGKYKTRLLTEIKTKVETEEQRGLFVLTFTAVFREGLEIVLFLSTVYFSSDPGSILTGFFSGAFLALIISTGLFTATLRLPIFYAFRVTSILLILFAAGLLVRGIGEFAEAGLLPVFGKIHLFFLPASETFSGSIIKAVLGFSQYIDIIQLTIYGIYIIYMTRRVFLRKTS